MNTGRSSSVENGLEPLTCRLRILFGAVELDVEASTNTRQRAANSLRAITPAGNVFDGVVRPEREDELELDADIAVASNRSMGVRFDYESSRAENSGVGGFTLAERGTNDAQRDWSFQLSERRLGEASVNDLRVWTPVVSDTRGFSYRPGLWWPQPDGAERLAATAVKSTP